VTNTFIIGKGLRARKIKYFKILAFPSLNPKSYIADYTAGCGYSLRGASGLRDLMLQMEMNIPGSH